MGVFFVALCAVKQIFFKNLLSMPVKLHKASLSEEGGTAQQRPIQALHNVILQAESNLRISRAMTEEVLPPSTTVKSKRCTTDSSGKIQPQN
jgi:hypothetical protein